MPKEANTVTIVETDIIQSVQMISKQEFEVKFKSINTDGNEYQSGFGIPISLIPYGNKVDVQVNFESANQEV